MHRLDVLHRLTPVARTFIASCSFALAVAATAAANVHLRVVARGAACAEEVTLRIRQCDRDPCAGAAREVRQRVGEDRLLAVADDRRWIVDVAAPAGCWSPPLAIDAHPLLPSSDLAVYRAARVRGRAKRSDGAALQQLTLQFTPLGADEPMRLPLVLERDGSFTGSIPAAVLDLRLVSEGLAPRYFSAVDLTAAGPHDLGEIVLTPGASVAGWISVPERRPSFANVTVKLIPDTLDVRNRNQAARAATPDRRGFFQFTNVIPGPYSVVAERKESSPARRTSISVAPASESLLDPPLRLNALTRLDVMISPPAGPDGKPWTVRVRRFLPMSTYTEDVASGSATLDGSWSHSAIETGTYNLRVYDTLGQAYLSRQVEIAPQMPPLILDLALIPVRGEVRAGDKPVECSVRFFSKANESISLAANANGRFAGYLTREGEWMYEVRIPKSRQTLMNGKMAIRRREGAEYAAADISLPEGKVHGRVVDPEGNGTHALVFLERQGRVTSQAESDSNGTFQIIGIEPGAGRVSAMKRELTAAPLSIDIVSDPPDVTLKLQKSRTIEMTAVTSSGAPIAGGMAWAAAPSQMVGGEVYISPSGHFTATVGADDSALSVAVVAPGLPVKIALLMIQNVDQATVVVPETGGTLRLKLGATPPWPFLIHDGGWQNVSALIIPGYQSGPMRPVPGGVEILVEPGNYLVCPARVADQRCVSATVAPNAIAEVEVKP